MIENDDGTNQNDDWDDSEDNGEGVSGSSVSQAVVTDTDWTTETILSQLRRGNIQLNPRFQRRDAWDFKRKSRFIESLLLNLPIPQVVLAESKERRGAFIVLDGKQRLLTLRQFAEGSSIGSNSGDEYRRLKLRNLEVRNDLNGFSLGKLESEHDHVDDLNSFLNQPIRTVVVRNWPDEAFLNLVFLRLNTGSVQLSAQELRQALHPGPFSDFLDDYTAESNSIQTALRNKTGLDFRMRDIEIALRYFAFKYYLDDYRGDLKKFLDTSVERLNERWSMEEKEVREVADRCDSGIDLAFDVFGGNAFYRWSGERYERRFNRALFDAVMFYFSDPSLQDDIASNKQNVEMALRELCVKDTDFTSSIQSTTKTAWATTYRIHAFGVALEDALNHVVSKPEVVALSGRGVSRQ